MHDLWAFCPWVVTKKTSARGRSLRLIGVLRKKFRGLLSADSHVSSDVVHFPTKPEMAAIQGEIAAIERVSLRSRRT
jgi:hypothetical protein